MNLLKRLEKELDQIQELQFILPEDHIRQDTKVILGEANRYAKKLHTLAILYRQKAEKAELDYKHARIANDEKTCQKAKKKYDEFNQKCRALTQLFWIVIRQQFNLWGVKHIGISINWEVICRDIDDYESPPINKIIQNLMTQELKCF